MVRGVPNRRRSALLARRARLVRSTRLARRVDLRRHRADRGTSAIELLFYTPILMFVIFLTVQFALYYIGHQIVSSTAREAARVVRTGGTLAEAQSAASAYATKIGSGLVTNLVITRQTPSAPLSVRIEVTARPLSLVTLPQLETVSAVSEGPLELFRPDN
ncbi:MAG: TadE/TadG family type IV pilus assembly protein [Lapillicoccus sp.]